MRAKAAQAENAGPEAEAQLASGIEAMAARIETIAASLEQA